MKNSHIRNLKSVVPLDIRIEVYRETAQWLIDRPREETLYTGLCFWLPMVMWGLKDYRENTPDGNPYFFGDTKTAFPELTRKRLSVLSEIDGENPVKVNTRIEILKEMLCEAESTKKRQSVVSETDFNVIRKDFLQMISCYVNKQCVSLPRSIENIQNMVYDLTIIGRLGEDVYQRDIQNCTGNITKTTVYDREKLIEQVLMGLLIEFEALCMEFDIPSTKVYQNIIENKLTN